MSEHRLDLSFSSERIDTPDPSPPNLVDEVTVKAPAGKNALTEVFVNLSSLLSDDAVKGWSFGVGVEGSASIVAYEVEGTAADRVPAGQVRDGFEMTVPLANKKGITSAVSLGMVQPATLPRIGTRSLLKLLVQADQLGPQKQRLV